MKILWHSNAPWAGTGYGNQTYLFTRAMQQAGHEVTVSAFYGLDGACLNIGGITVAGKYRDDYGNDILPAHQAFYNPDVTIGLLDIWVLNPEMLKSLNNYWHWCPIDHSPTPPATIASIKAIDGRVIAMSQFGERLLRAEGFDPIYIPHGVDTDTLKPIPMAEARTRMGLPVDAYIIGMVMANKGAPSRKAFDQQIRAVGKFIKRNPDVPVVLYLHTDKTGWIGEDLPAMIERVEKDQEIKINAIFAPQYRYISGMIGMPDMAVVYSACNVVMNATKGEGFGIPIIEAQACGCPVIVTNCTAMPELCKVGQVADWSDKFWTPQQSYQFVPDVDDLADCLQKEYALRDDMERRADARKAMVADYDVKVVWERYWIPALERMAKKPDVSDVLQGDNPHPLTPSPSDGEGEQNISTEEEKPSPVIEEKAVANVGD